MSNLYPPHYLGGAELLCQQVVERLSAKGHEVRVLTSTFRTKVSEADINGVRVLRRLQLQVSFDAPSGHHYGRLDHQIKPDAANRRITEQVLQDYHPDLVFAWSQRRLGVAPVRTCQRVGIPTVLIFNDDSPSGYMPARFKWFNPKAWYRFIADRTLFRRHTVLEWDFRFVTCISKCIRDHLVAVGVPIESAKVIYQGIPLPEFPPKEAPGELNDPIQILYVGQFLESKGVHTLVEAYSQVTSSLGGTRIEMTLVGDGPDEYKRRLQELAPPGGTVKFVGKQPYAQLPAIYREHDILVFPSIVKEGFGLTFLEAMASGTTVISTTLGGQAECLQDGVNALTFRAEDSRQLAQCIVRLVSDPRLSRRLALEARRMVEHDYSLDRYVDNLEEFLEACRDQPNTIIPPRLLAR